MSPKESMNEWASRSEERRAAEADDAKGPRCRTGGRVSSGKGHDPLDHDRGRPARDRVDLVLPLWPPSNRLGVEAPVENHGRRLPTK